MKTNGIKIEKQPHWVLAAVADADREWMVTVNSFPFVVGRTEECDLKLIDKRISRQHCEIRNSGEYLWIRDLGSTNGTFLNKKKIKQAELLEPGDIISIGLFDFSIKSVKPNIETTTEATQYMGDIPQEVNQLNSLEPKLKTLLSNRDVIPHFQPILNLSDMAVTGYEILGRFPDGDLPSNPAEILALAGLFGYAPELSALIREVGVDLGRNLPGSPKLFVNISPMEVYQMNDLLASLEKIRDIDPSSRIVLEINEKAITSTDEMSRLRYSLGKLNMGLAFDDFGVGQTRLAELAKAPPDYLKFDRSLIHHIHNAPVRLHQMLSTFVNAAQAVGIATLAEGIECSEEAETCRQLGFDFAQGFFYSRPLPIHEITYPVAFLASSVTGEEEENLDYVEKRRFPRTDANRLIPYYLLNKDDEILNAGLGTMKNISDVGLLIVTDKLIESDYILILAADENSKIVEMKGKVSHSRKEKTGQVYSGIEFLSDDDNKSQFAKYLRIQRD